MTPEVEEPIVFGHLGATNEAKSPSADPQNVAWRRIV